MKMAQTTCHQPRHPCCSDWDDFHVSGDNGSSCKQLLWGVSARASHLCHAAKRVSALLASTESSIFCPAISCPAFSGCALLCPTHLVRHFHVLQFHALHIGPSFSRPAISCLANSSKIGPSISCPAFSVNPHTVATHLNNGNTPNQTSHYK